MTTHGGSVVNHIRYGAFDNIRSMTESPLRPRAAYTAAPTDAESGFVYLCVEIQRLVWRLA